MLAAAQWLYSDSKNMTLACYEILSDQGFFYSFPCFYGSEHMMDPTIVKMRWKHC